MSPLDMMRARAEELRAEINAHYTQRGALIDTAATEKRGFTDTEQATYDDLGTKRAAAEKELKVVEERIAELEEIERRETLAAQARALGGVVPEQRAPGRTQDAPIYAKGNVERSYLRDLFDATQRGSAEALDRLRRNDKMLMEARALSTTAGAVGEFAPPAWFIADFIALARPGRKFADSLDPQPLPRGVSSVNLPKVTGGTTTAVQATQNSALSQTDMTSSSVSSGISTIGGKQVVSMQLLEQSGIPFDEVILRDLAADYAKQFDNQSINGSAATGQLNGVYTYFNASGTQNVIWTQATPAVGGAGGLYAKIFNACSNIESSRFLAPDTIWMHPRRWNWILASSDGQNRPLVVPAGLSDFNAIGTTNGPVPQGAVGTLGSLAVITDANIPTNLGAGTNQDPILVGVRTDLRLWESELQMETFTAPYADSAGVLFRALAYSAAIPSRYATSVAVINGTGSVAPTF